MKDPETRPLLPAMPHIAETNVMLGTTVRLQYMARELNPDPDTLATVPFAPVVGTTEIFGMTPNGAVALSFTGEPRTVTFHFTSTVAVGPTTKLPVGTPLLIEQVGEVIRSVVGLDSTEQDVSDVEKPVPVKVTTDPVLALVG
jgi:hypothetical protein